MDQSDLTSWEDGERPTAEAEAVAGNGGTDADLVDTAEHRYPDADGTVAFAVTQVDYTVEGRGDDEYPVVHVFGRTADRDPVHVQVEEFRPYFYAPVDSVTEGDLRQYDRITGWEYEDDNGDPYESIRGAKLVKVFGQTPRDVGQLRDDFEHYEADILFPNRFLIDKDVTSGVRVPCRRDGDRLRVHHAEVQPVEVDVEPRVNTFDIEVDDRSGFPEDGEEPVICLTSHDSYDDEYIVWLYQPPDGVDGPEVLDGYDPLEGDFETDVRSFETEEAMLGSFLNYLDGTDPDVMTGWNFTDFDAPYLIDRLDVLADRGDTDHDLSYDRLSRVDEVWRSDWRGPDVKGRVVFDLLYAYQRTKFTELDSYRLDDVGERELGVGKERYAGDIGDLWEQEPERLLEYNLRDVELCVELDRDQDIVAFWNEVRQFVGCKLEDATTPGDAVDMYVLHKLHDEYALPSKGQQDSEDYEGGAVFDPITGVRENVSVLDLKCFSSDTEVLTPEGPRNITDIQVGDPIYTLDPDTFECEVKPVAETHEYENRFGELHHLSGNTHDFKITENHRFLVSNERGWDEQSPGDFEFAEYRNIPDYERFAFPQHEPMDGRHPETFDFVSRVQEGQVVVYSEDDLRRFRNRMPESVTESLDLAHGTSVAAGLQQKVGKYLIPLSVYRSNREVIDEHADDVFLKYDRQHRETPLAFEMEHWLEFLGWFVTEGSTDADNGRLTLHQSDSDGRAAIQSLLDRMEVNYSTDEHGINISNQYLVDWLEENCGDGYAEKRLPEWVFNLDGELVSVLLETMVDGDGSRTESGLRKFWTKSDALKNDIVEVAVRCGHKPTVTKESDGTWYVSIGKRGSFKKETNATVEQHDGTVHCITAEDNHVVMAGRNGHFQWVGQSLYPMCMVTTNASPETKVDPERYDGETYRAPNGTHFRKQPDGAIREMVDELLAERDEKKSLRDDHDPDEPAYEQYDRQQQAVKVIMNSLYGVLGWDRFRLYDKEMGAAVTATGREVIEFTETAAAERDKKVVYGDSVTGDRPVVVRDPEGIVRIIPVECLFERATPDTEEEVLITADGGAVAEVSRGKARRELTDWDALSLSETGDPEWQPIEQVVRHETDKPVVTLQHKFGESTTTRDHSYVVEEGGDFVEVAPESVDEPLRIPGIPDVDTVDEIDVYALLDGYMREYEDGRSVGADDAEMKIKRVHADGEHVWFGHGHHGDLDSTIKVQRYVDPDSSDGEALLRLIAAYITEGSATTVETAESKFGASIAESRHRWLETLKEDYEQLFENATVSIVASDTNDQRVVDYETQHTESSVTYDDRTQKLQMMNELSAVFFRELAGQTSRGKRIPGFVFNLDDEKQQLFLDVLVEGDGSREFPRYSEEYTQRHFDFETTSRELAGGLSTLLVQHGRKHSLKYRDAKESYTIRTCDYYRQGRDPQLTETEHDGYVYDLSVAENENFVDAVGGVVLHNTDSVMLELGDEVSKEEAIEQSFDLEKYINDRYDEFALERLNAEGHRFEIEFEKLYRRFFQAGKKKRYAGHIVWKEGKDVDDIDITGFEYQRSDIAPITKEVQKEVIDMIVMGEDPEGVKSYLHDVIQDFRAGNVDLDDVGIPGGIGKRLDNYDTDTAQVRGAKYANAVLGTNFQRGSKPKRLYLDRVHSDFLERIEAEEGLDPSTDPVYGAFRRDPDVVCFEYPDQVPEEFEVDWDKMLDKTLKGPIERIIGALDISWEEVKTGQEQTGLGSFM